METNGGGLDENPQTYVTLLLVPLLLKIMLVGWDNLAMRTLMETHAAEDDQRFLKLRIIFLVQNQERVLSDSRLNLLMISLLASHAAECKVPSCFCRRAGELIKGVKSKDQFMNENMQANLRML